VSATTRAASMSCERYERYQNSSGQKGAKTTHESVEGQAMHAARTRNQNSRGTGPVFARKSTLTNNDNSGVVSEIRPGTEIVPAKSARKAHIYSEG